MREIATAVLVVQIGDRGTWGEGGYSAARQVAVQARYSRDGGRITAVVGPGGWFSADQVLAERHGEAWISALEWPLRVTSERSGDRWRAVRDGNIGVAPRRQERGRQDRGLSW